MRKLLIAAALTSGLTTAAAGGRHRTVSPPPAPSAVLMNVGVGESLRYTNLGTSAQTVMTCVERTNRCINDVLEPGASVTRNSSELTSNRATLEVFGSPLEVRAHFDAIPTKYATASRQTIPVMDPTETLTIYSSPGTAELKLLGNNGVQVDSRTITLGNGTTTITPGFSLASLFNNGVGAQYDFLPTTPAIVTTTVNGTQFRAKNLFEATGSQFMTTVDESTSGWVRNIDPTAVLPVDTFFYAPGNATGNANYVKNFNAVNWGTVYLGFMTNGGTGSVAARGMFVTDHNTPFLFWSSANPQVQGATANTQFISATRYNTSLNQPADKLTVFAPDGSVTYTITGYNDLNSQTGTITGTLERNETRDLDITGLHASRVVASAGDRTDNSTAVPNLIIGANVDGVNKGGWPYAKPLAPKYSGLDYWKAQGAHLVNGQFNLNQDEAKWLIDNYADEIADILINSDVSVCTPDQCSPGWPYGAFTRATVATYLRQLANCDAADPELLPGVDPIVRVPKGMAFYESAGRSLDFDNPANAANTWNLLQKAMVRRATELPANYGGNATLGPDPNYPSSWNTFDRTNSTYCK